MSQCYIPSLYVVHFKGALNSGEAQPFVSTFAKPLSINIRLLAGSSSLRPALPCRTGIASKSPSTPKYLTPTPACTKEISELLGMSLASWRNRQMTKKRSNYSLSQTKLSPSGARAIPSFLFSKKTHRIKFSCAPTTWAARKA